MSYNGIFGNKAYIFDAVEDYLLAIEIMEDLQEIFEERMGYCDVIFEFCDKSDINPEVKVE